MTGVSILDHLDSPVTKKASLSSHQVVRYIKSSHRKYPTSIYLVAGDVDCVFIVLEVKTENDNIGAFIKNTVTSYQ